MKLNLNQTATLWRYSNVDGWGGKSFSSPVAIDCRWEDKQEQVVDTHGQEVLSAARVYVDTDITTGSYLYLGTSTESTPTDQSGAREVIAFAKVPNLKGTEFVRKVWLKG